MSNSVVPAAAVARAKQLVQKKKLIKRTEDQKPAQDERDEDQKDPDAANVVQTGEGDHATATMSDTTMSGDFSFMGALAAAADSSASLTAEVAQDDGGGMSDDDDGAGGTVLLVGAVGLVGAGIYVLADGGGKSNDPPAFAADTQAVTTKEDTPVTATAAATDPDGDPLAYSVSTQPTKGTVTIGAGDGKFTYTPSADFSGKDSFVVTVNDGQGGTDTITVNVTIDPVNDAPRADKTNSSALTTAEDTPVEVVVSFTDPEGNTPLVGPTVTDPPDKGTFALVGGKNIYTPGPNFNGEDSLTYTVTDSLGAVTTQTVKITVTPVNDAPTVAATQTVVTSENDAVTGTVAASDVDIATNGDVLTYTIKDADKADNGTVTIGADGKFTYTPNADFDGTDNFIVTVADKAGATATQTVNVTVNPDVNIIDIDVTGASSTTPLTVPGTAGKDVFADTADGGAVNDTDVFITGFAEGDIIAVTGAAEGDYNFSSGEGSTSGDPNDLYITYVDGTGTSNLILIDDVLPDGAFVFDYDTAVDAVGFEFMTFG